jgi:hypothetical protein
VVCASPAEGGAQTALATVARRLDKRATIFVARRAKPHPRTVEAAKLGAQIIGVAPGYLIGQIRQDDKANVVLGEALSVSVEPKPLEPVRYLLHRLPARLNRQAPHSPEPITSSRDFVAAPPVQPAGPFRVNYDQSAQQAACRLCPRKQITADIRNRRSVPIPTELGRFQIEGRAYAAVISRRWQHFTIR